MFELRNEMEFRMSLFVGGVFLVEMLHIWDFEYKMKGRRMKFKKIFITGIIGEMLED